MADTYPQVGLILQLWAPIGVFAALLFGHLLARSWDKKRWLRDCRKEEFRQLLSALTTEILAHIEYFAARDVEAAACANDPTRPPDFKRAKRMLAELDKSHQASMQVILDRLYIAKDLHALQVRRRFTSIMERARNDRTTESVVEELNALVVEIQDRALKS